MADLTVFVCTYNSARTLERCLKSLGKGILRVRLVVIDHISTDETVKIARRFGAEVFVEELGLGYARQLAFDIVDTDFLAFVDSDVEVVEPRFFEKAITALMPPDVGAVVGMAVGHRFAYGLPAGLLMLRSRDFEGKIIPNQIDARETFYLQKQLNKRGLRTVYIADSMIHKSGFRKFKPEWEGANTRIACGLSLRQLRFVFKVFVLMSLNSRSIKNISYVPILYLKCLRGFVQPDRWRKLKLVN